MGRETTSVLVVDDDTTCLSIVAAILKKFNYQVVTVKHPNDALCTLRIKGDIFNLVVSDVHMPDMNGFQLQQVIAQEFNLPVVLMSADVKLGVISKGLENGAALFISKPVSADDFRNLWQFAAIKKKSQVVIEETAGNCFCEEIASAHKSNSDDEIVVSASALNEAKTDSKRKLVREEGSVGKKGDNLQSVSNKKHKVIWNNSLHNRFLEAIRSIGLDRAVPKKILEVMNVPGLTRENVASHLQKYRIFLRRVSDASYKIHYADNHKGLISRSPRPSLASLGTNTINRVKIPYQNQETFPSSFLAQSGIRQSQLLPITGSLLVQKIRNADMTRTSPSILGIFNTLNSSESSKNFTNQTNYVGYKISNIKQFAEPGISKDNHGFNAAAFTNDDVNPDHLLTHQHLETSSYVSDHNSDGKQLSDVIADYRNVLLPSNLPELDIIATQHQPQQNEGTSCNFYRDMNDWDNHVASYDQVPNQQEDDDFLESLLGPCPFEEYQNLEEEI